MLAFAWWFATFLVKKVAKAQGTPVTAVAWNPQHLLLSVAAEEVCNRDPEGFRFGSDVVELCPSVLQNGFCLPGYVHYAIHVHSIAQNVFFLDPGLELPVRDLVDQIQTLSKIYNDQMGGAKKCWLQQIVELKWLTFQAPSTMSEARVVEIEDMENCCLVQKLQEKAETQVTVASLLEFKEAPNRSFVNRRVHEIELMLVGCLCSSFHYYCPILSMIWLRWLETIVALGRYSPQHQQWQRRLCLDIGIYQPESKICCLGGFHSISTITTTQWFSTGLKEAVCTGKNPQRCMIQSQIAIAQVFVILRVHVAVQSTNRAPIRRQWSLQKVRRMRTLQ